MINLSDVSLQRGANTLLEKLNLTLFVKDKVGLIGKNGSGKSSLFAIFTNELEPARGEINLPKNLRVAHLKQETPSLEISALEFVIQGDADVANIRAKIKHAEETEDYDQLGDLYTKLSEIDGYSVEAKAAKILHGLGFSSEAMQEAVKTFSGGWRMRLNLGQCLLQPSDLMLLDEPTNHLDLEAVLWLEDWLQKYPGTLLVISHDRDFLDGVVGQIWHVEHKTINSYRGNYSQFEDLRAERIALQNSQVQKQQAHRAHIESYVNRFRAQASKARQVQSRLKLLSRLEKLETYYEQRDFRFAFLPPAKTADTLLSLDKVAIGYDDNLILKNVRLRIAAGSRIGLLGKNGAGKSTLMKLLIEQLKPQTGTFTKHPNLLIGYFAQHQVDALHLNQSPFEHLQDLDKRASTQDSRDYLGKFGFNGDCVFEPVTKFSGGEKARLALALIIYQRPNLLLLDEPTNHLDLQMREALMIALQEFSGAMLLVSHDRYLLRSCVDNLWLAKNKTITEYSGDVGDYLMNEGRE